MTIDQQTISALLQLGGQYFLPVAALLRALYAGYRGQLPKGVSQIALASVFAGVTAATDTGQPQFELQVVVATILGNAAFTAGLLIFIVLYLLRQPDRGKVVDAIVGAVIGAITWVVWVYVLKNEWPWWTAPLTIAAGGAGFVVLRFALRQIMRVMRVATFLIVIGGLIVLGAGGIWLYQQLTQTAAV